MPKEYVPVIKITLLQMKPLPLGLLIIELTLLAADNIKTDNTLLSATFLF